MAKSLSDESLNKYRQDLIESDLKFAKSLDSLQKKHFPKRLKNMSEWAEAEKVKRLILGLNTDKTEHSGTVNVNFTDRLNAAKQRAAEALKRGSNGN